MQQIKTLKNLEHLSLTDNLLKVSTTTPIPPGSRVSLDLAMGSASDMDPFQGKVTTVEKSGPGSFKVHIRLHSISKKQDEFLKSLFN